VQRKMSRWVPLCCLVNFLGNAGAQLASIKYKLGMLSLSWIDRINARKTLTAYTDIKDVSYN